jgi:hypothetical protein
LLTTTAGRVFWISPPTEGSKATSQTSRRRGEGAVVTLRFVCHVSQQGVAPGGSFCHTGFIGGHRGVSGGQILADDVGLSEAVQKAADAATADDAVQAVVDLGIDGDRRFLRHEGSDTYQNTPKGLDCNWRWAMPKEKSWVTGPTLVRLLARRVMLRW